MAACGNRCAVAVARGQRLACAYPALHLGVILPHYGEALDAERLAGVAVAMEQASLDSRWLPDRVIAPAEYAGTYRTQS